MPRSHKYRIAHYSDFHLIDTGLEFERAMSLLRDGINQEVDHIVITGDIVDAAQTKVVGALWARLRRLKWTSGTRITFCPGNHDIFPATKRCLSFLTGFWPTKRFRELCSLTRFSRQGIGVQSLGSPYPVGKVLSESVVISALDTTRNGEYLPNRWARGEIKREAQESVSSFFEQHLDKPHRIVAMHHTPLEILSEYDIAEMNFCSPNPSKVQQWLRECRATFVMCGHVHSETVRDKLHKGCWLLQSGTAGGVDEDYDADDGIRTYHIIEFGDTGRVRIVERSFRGWELDRC